VTPAITPIPLSDSSAAHLWDAFAATLGPEVLEACYGWKTAPPALRLGERAWAYRGLTPAFVGWGSLIKHPTTDVYWQASGVFPAFQRRGYRQAIRRHLCTTAFDLGATAVAIEVLDTNTEHLDRCFRESNANGPFQPSGFNCLPAPGFTIFTMLRKDAPAEWLTEHACCCHHLHEPGTCAPKGDDR
jgi:GNAT superfamily N-acetyltransferase